MYTGLELRTIARGDSLPLPKIINATWMDYAFGVYYEPEEEDLILCLPSGEEVINENGVIIISINDNLINHYDDWYNYEAILAHEYRHHWQIFNGVPSKTINKNITINMNSVLLLDGVHTSDKNLINQKIEYYNQQSDPKEIDAMLFEIKHSGPDYVRKTLNVMGIEY